MTMTTQAKQTRLLDRLIELAEDRECRTYGELAPSLGLDMNEEPHRREIRELLDAINRAEHAAGRPLLTALVVQSGTGMPGPGFFALATRLDYEVGRDRRAFWERERERVYSYWAQQTPTQIPSAPEQERIRRQGGEDLPLPKPERPIAPPPPPPQQPPRRGP